MHDTLLQASSPPLMDEAFLIVADSSEAGTTDWDDLFPPEQDLLGQKIIRFPSSLSKLDAPTTYKLPSLIDPNILCYKNLSLTHSNSLKFDAHISSLLPALSLESRLMDIHHAVALSLQ